MGDFGKISDSEYEVMELVWELGEATVPAVFNKLENKKWAYNTVATFMQRLCEKGLLESRKAGKANIYKATLSKENYKKSLTIDFLNTVYNGSRRSLIASLFDGKVSNEAIDEMLKQIEGE